jgi:osmotically-inducible protein OsmY
MRLWTKLSALALAVAVMAAPGFATITPASIAQPVDSQVRHALNTLAYYGVFDNLMYQVQDGKVILTGQVMAPIVKLDAESAVKRIAGVTSVDNNIEVLPLSSFDDSIRIRTYRAIYGQPALSRYALNARPPIRIIVKNGNVTLEGYVNSKLDRDLAYNRAMGVPGVFSVTNHLKLDSES